MTARVVAVSSSAKHGFSKEPRDAIRLIAGEGVEGDAHRGRTTQHIYRKRKDPTQPNLTQVHLLGDETLSELRMKGFAIAPGELGENILTSGTDLLSLPLGTLLHIANGALIEITGLRTPCSQVDKYQDGLQHHLWGERDETGRKTRRAGIMGVVLQGGIVAPGYAMEIEYPARPHRPLPGV